MTEKEFMSNQFNYFMQLGTTGEKHIDKKIIIIKEYLPKLDIEVDGGIHIENLIDKEKGILRNTLIAYVEILDRKHQNNDDLFKFLQYIKNILVIDKKLN